MWLESSQNSRGHRVASESSWALFAPDISPSCPVVEANEHSINTPIVSGSICSACPRVKRHQNVEVTTRGEHWGGWTLISMLGYRDEKAERTHVPLHCG